MLFDLAQKASWEKVVRSLSDMGERLAADKLRNRYVGAIISQDSAGFISTATEDQPSEAQTAGAVSYLYSRKQLTNYRR